MSPKEQVLLKEQSEIFLYLCAEFHSVHRKKSFALRQSSDLSPQRSTMFIKFPIACFFYDIKIYSNHFTALSVSFFSIYITIYLDTRTCYLFFFHSPLLSCLLSIPWRSKNSCTQNSAKDVKDCDNLKKKKSLFFFPF